MRRMSHSGIKPESLAHMTDEDIVFLVQETGDKRAEEYLVKKYRNLVRARCRAFFLLGADEEDLMQEGMYGLYKATRDYKDDKNASFKAFAEVCITRQVITAVKTANRQKHMPLNNYVSLYKPVSSENSERTLLDILVSTYETNPEEIIIAKEEYREIERHLREILSPLEWKVLRYYLNGITYQDIAERINRPVKSIDNALQRVKRKVEGYLLERKLSETSGKDE